jgi:hypothetical protein
MPAYVHWVDSQGKTSALVFDIVEREEHESDSKITDHAVETGSAITDHVREEPRSLTLNTWVTMTPLTDKAKLGIEADRILGARNMFLEGKDLVYQSRTLLQSAVKLDVPYYKPSPAFGPGIINQASDLIRNAIFPKAPDVADVFGRVLLGTRRDKVLVQDRGVAYDPLVILYQTLESLKAVSQLCTVITRFKAYESMALKSWSIPYGKEGGVACKLSFRRLRIVRTRTASVPAITSGYAPVKKGDKPAETPSVWDKIKAQAREKSDGVRRLRTTRP